MKSFWESRTLFSKRVLAAGGIMTKLKELTIWDVHREALEAEKRIKNYIRETPLEQDFFLSQLGDGNVFLKLENFQLTGSFKLRGAFNRLLTLSAEERDAGVVTASSGNHGAAFTYAARLLGYRGVVVVPENVSTAKLDVLHLYGAELISYGTDCVEAENFAREMAEKQGKMFISPYNDPMIIAGQGTVGIEILKQLGNIDAVFVPVGGGGLMSGVAGYLKAMNSKIQLIGCQPENSPVMYESVKAGRIIIMESKPTLSDGSAGGIEEGSITFGICCDFVDEYILVTEDEIKGAIRLVLEKTYMLIEGAAALSVASFIKEKERFKNKNIVLVISGKKISLDTLRKILV
jgi:threonine dehydratase